MIAHSKCQVEAFILRTSCIPSKEFKSNKQLDDGKIMTEAIVATKNTEARRVAHFDLKKQYSKNDAMTR